MKERPILFSTEMVEAILEGRKSQTRRIYKKADPDIDLYAIQAHSKDYILSQCPYGHPGDQLWVRETFAMLHGQPVYKAGYATPDGKGNAPLAKEGNWKPSIFMPKEAARIWLEITEVRVERLLDISEVDAKDEGIAMHRPVPGDGNTIYKDYGKAKPGCFKPSTLWNNRTSLSGMGHFNSPIDSFKSLWQSIHGPGSWEKNPWLWVVCFRVLSTSGRPA